MALNERRHHDYASTPCFTLLLCSPNAAELKRWYSEAFDVVENELGALEFGDVDFYIEDHSEISGPTKEPARVMACLNIEDFDTVEQRLRSLGVQFRPRHREDVIRLAGNCLRPGRQLPSAHTVEGSFRAPTELNSILSSGRRGTPEAAQRERYAYRDDEDAPPDHRRHGMFQLP